MAEEPQNICQPRRFWASIISTLVENDIHIEADSYILWFSWERAQCGLSVDKVC
jgi:hypothetical protein